MGVKNRGTGGWRPDERLDRCSCCPAPSGSGGEPNMAEITSDGDMQDNGRKETSPFERAICAWILQLPGKWTRPDWQQLSQTQEASLYRLVRGGFVQARLPVALHVAGEASQIDTVWTVSGDYGPILSGNIRVYLAAHGHEGKETRIETGQYEEVRLTADGELAQQDFKKPRLDYETFSLVAGGPDGQGGVKPPGVVTLESSRPVTPNANEQATPTQENGNRAMPPEAAANQRNHDKGREPDDSRRRVIAGSASWAVGDEQPSLTFIGQAAFVLNEWDLSAAMARHKAAVAAWKSLRKSQRSRQQRLSLGDDQSPEAIYARATRREIDRHLELNFWLVRAIDMSLPKLASNCDFIRRLPRACGSNLGMLEQPDLWVLARDTYQSLWANAEYEIRAVQATVHCERSSAGDEGTPNGHLSDPVSSAAEPGVPELTPETDSKLIYQSDAATFYNIPKSTLSKAAAKTPGDLGYLWSGRKGSRVFYRKADLEKLAKSRRKLRGT